MGIVTSMGDPAPFIIGMIVGDWLFDDINSQFSDTTIITAATCGTKIIILP
jgi:Na+/H+ antiporter NhaC